MPDGQGRPLAAHADWSIDPRKRWVAIAAPTASGWHLEPPGLVGDVTIFLSRLRQQSPNHMVALGLDVPIGIPRAYAAPRPERDFQDFLRQTKDWPDFYQVCATLDDIAAERPFYPARGIAGMTRASHAHALGLDGGGAALSRACDRATAERPAGAPVFWTLGANQSGKAAIAAWRDMLIPALDSGETIRLWPFAGPFRSLLTPGTIAIAETYPAEALRHLGIKLKGSKRRQSDRAAVADTLFQAMVRLSVTPAAPPSWTVSAPPPTARTSSTARSASSALSTSWRATAPIPRPKIRGCIVGRAGSWVKRRYRSIRRPSRRRQLKSRKLERRRDHASTQSPRSEAARRLPVILRNEPL